MTRALAVLAAGLPLAGFASVAVLAAAASLRLVARAVARAGQAERVGRSAVGTPLFRTVFAVPRIGARASGVLLANAVARALIFARLDAARWTVPPVLADALRVDADALVFGARRGA